MGRAPPQHDVGLEKVRRVGEVRSMKSYPPSHLLQRISGDARAESFVNSFPHVRNEVKRYLELAGFEFSRFGNILDFGCGVGRFLFAVHPELGPGQRLWGCDVFDECVRWCQQNVEFATVVRNHLQPPLPFDDGQFDLVHAVSVFTHLRLDLQFPWAWEIYRILRPGGVLFMTLHGPHFFPVLCEAQDSHHAEIFAFGDDSLFAQVDQKVGDEDQVQFLAAMHSPSFTRDVFAVFQHIKRFPQSTIAGGQDLYILQKPTAGRRIAQPQPPMTSYDERFGSGDEHRGGLLRFSLQGQRTFRVYPRIEPAGHYCVSCDIEIGTPEHVLVRQRTPFNNGRVFGRTYYAAIEVPVPEFRGEAAVSLRTVIADQQTLPRDRPVKPSWHFPHFC